MHLVIEALDNLIFGVLTYSKPMNALLLPYF